MLGSGKNIIWFPEGQRSGSGELQTFKRGIGMLLVHHQVPVVPVFIQGTYEAMPSGKVTVRPGKVTVVFGEPLGVQELEDRGTGDRPQDRIVDGLRDRVKELGGSLRGVRPP